ncbi:DUF4192 domain-containing protein [Streptosporangiaceae bacterium NEAU-GS5]|nr:DUF4192 domain-containing protein [Streptosporangiaceae bacterium NEAU-GS5]
MTPTPQPLPQADPEVPEGRGQGPEGQGQGPKKATLVLSTRGDILAAIPYLLHFHPVDSMVVIGFAGSVLALATRWDLPGAFAELMPTLLREKVTNVVLVGYGHASLVTPAMEQVLQTMEAFKVTVLEALRAEDGRYWSYLCGKPGCCPPGGVPYDDMAGPVATEAVVNGLVAFPDREALAKTVEPCTGPDRTAMTVATAATAAGLRTRLASFRPAATIEGAKGDALVHTLVTEGIARVHAAIDLYAEGGRLDDPDASRLGFDLAMIRVRDEAWACVDDRPAHIELWKDLTRRLEPHHAAPAASLLAAAAWHAGDCTLAGLALDRALSADPDYSMAHLLGTAVRQLVSPRSLRERMPDPAELDAQMGPPKASWLVPLLDLLQPPAAAQAAG